MDQIVDWLKELWRALAGNGPARPAPVPVPVRVDERRRR